MPYTESSSCFGSRSSHGEGGPYWKRTYRRLPIILAIIGGILILSLLAVALVFIIRSIDGEDDTLGSSRIRLEDVLYGKWAARQFNGTWDAKGNIIYKHSKKIMEYNVQSNERTQIYSHESPIYTFTERSADGRYLLLAKKFKKNFRHSFFAEYDVHDIKGSTTFPLEINGRQLPLYLVQWSPEGHSLVINYQRNLYYKEKPDSKEIKITDDENNAILNGIPDWVYEEEVLGSNSALWFSPNGDQLAFIQFDESPIRVINFPVYGEAGDSHFQYPYNRLIAYPKAGSPNPSVKLYTADLKRAAAGQSDFLTHINVPSALNTQNDYIITVVDWINGTDLLSVWMNRIQNTAHLQIDKINPSRRREIYSIKSDSGWVDLFTAPYKDANGTSLALILPQKQNDGDEYRHLCVLSTTDSLQPRPLTKGKFVVTAIRHWDHETNLIFYMANTEQNSEELHLYAIKASDSSMTPICVTCKLHYDYNGNEQNYFAAEFNAFNHVVISSLGPSVPFTAIYRWSFKNNKIILSKTLDWEKNENLIRNLNEYLLPEIEIHTIPLEDDFSAKVLLQLPPNMDRSGNKKYPMLVDVYGGPDSYSVVNKWGVDWGSYLSSNRSVIYAKIDGRGSGLRGNRLLHSIYKKLGTVEINDQVTVTRELQKRFPYIDENHTGIWGWSYGGYAAAMSLAIDTQNVFHCAASVAPVTDWTYYDSIYTERYMTLPYDNEEGYKNSRLSTKANQLKGKLFLLVHGTLDDNVHYQQAMILAKNLERQDILFKQISYPDEDHSLAGVRPHLFHSLNRFFGECFGKVQL